MPKDETENYNFYATLTGPQETVKRVLCRIWLPKRMTESIRMVFYPTQRQAHHHHAPLGQFSVEGRIVGFAGNTTTIRATEAWVSSVPSRTLSKTRRETVFEADPIDLQIYSTARPGRPKRRKLKAYIDYAITPTPRELSPAAAFTYKSNGAVSVETVRQFTFTLRGGRRLKFVKRYKHERGDVEDVTWSQLVAHEQREVPRAEFARVNHGALADIDDFLLLVSFASRYRIMCIGVDAYSDHGDHFIFYRKNMSVPEQEREDRNDAVIDLSDFSKFIRKAYRQFIRSGKDGPDELLRHALHLVMPHQDRTVESEFTTLYAALETLVLWHRRKVGLEFIIDDKTAWRELRDDVGAFLKKHPLLANDKEKRKLIRPKLEELNRVPFSTAFQRFRSDYAVHLDDLWPVNGGRGEMSLSEIRNHIVHGSVLTWSQWTALGDARSHLRWTVERMILAVLGWPLDDSKVRPAWLARNRTEMIERDASRRAMQLLPDVLMPQEAQS